MRRINIYAHGYASNYIEEGMFTKFLNHETLFKNKNIRMKEEEDLRNFISYMRGFNDDYKTYADFYYGYNIPQISKEFDLLKICNDNIINIEIKNNCSLEKACEQLIRNKYYLSFLKRRVNLYCYICEQEKLYCLDENAQLVEITGQELITILHQADNVDITDINTLFRPSNYLVSPFNNTDEFLCGNYFLTSQQENFKTEIMKLLNNKEDVLITLQGEAGSGKTLLTFDIAKELIKSNKRIAIIHCGLLNDGHRKIDEHQDWNIYAIKYHNNIDFSKIDALIIDEGQRIYPDQLNKIIEKMKTYKFNSIYSFDPVQTLSNKENYYNSIDIAKESAVKKIELTGKIRTNKEIIYFIRNFFTLRNRNPEMKYENIYTHYFPDYDKSIKYLKYLTNEGWHLINYTPSTIKQEDFECLKSIENDCAHTVIGQEFDKVAVVVDQKFTYQNGNLKSHGWKSRNNGEKMLFQAMTRTREKLYIIFIKNTEVMDECLNILNQHL